MLQVDHIETRSHSDTNLTARKRQPYQAVHPHSNHHRRVRAPPKVEPEVCVTNLYDNESEDVSSPEITDSNPNDPFEKHFLAAALAPAPEPVGRSSSFRNDKPKPIVVKRDPELVSAGSFSSSPNLLFPKDDLHYDNRLNENRSDAPLRRVRSFKTSSKGGVINRGDSFRKKHSSRNLASGSTNGRDSPRLAAASSQQLVIEPMQQAETQQSSYFRVQVMGAPGCGKTSITNQFMSSDYANAYDSMNTDEVERTVTIQLDGEEYTMEFIDKLPWDVRMQDSELEWSPFADQQMPRDLEDSHMIDDTVDHDVDLNADAFIIVYSVIDRSTYDAAVASLVKLRQGYGTDRPIVLCGNKIDLVRKRRVKKDEVLSTARQYDCLHYETSAALNHNVDDLLVAILKQIRHKLYPDIHPNPMITEIGKGKQERKGSFFSRLYKRLSRKGRSKSKKW